MAKIKFGQIVSEARGKLGGLVFSRNHSGAIMRQKVTPVNPNSTAQARVRAYFGDAAKAWKGLTDAVRLGFKSGTSDAKSTDIFGDIKTLTGFNYFVKLYKTAMDIGESPLAAYAGSSNPVSISAITPVATFGPKYVGIQLISAIPVTEKALLYCSPPLSSGKNYVKSEFRLVKVLTNGDGTVIDVTAEHTAIFGGSAVEGDVIHFKFLPVLLSSMRTGNAVFAKLAISEGS